MDNTMRNTIDKIWENFWSGGVTNPLTVIEQITYLLFIKDLDDTEIKRQEEAGKKKISSLFDEKHQNCRWSVFKNYPEERMYNTVQKKVFPFIKKLSNDKESGYAKYMKDATFIIPTSIMLQRVVKAIDTLDLENRDTKGDIYEYLLSKLSTAGTNGQFRTPRHIIKMMVELTQPTLEDMVVDPACGSAGFLIAVVEFLREQCKGIPEKEEEIEQLDNSMLSGFDMDRTMLRIGAMNLLQHGVRNPNIQYKDSLSQDNTEENKYTLVLANPPFKGHIDDERIAPNLIKVTNTKKTELLFLALFLRILQKGGRAATIVPDGVLFGSSAAHKAIREELVEHNKVEAIISMPSGVFKPYAGVSTAVILFSKKDKENTDRVWFYQMRADGFSLDDQRQPIKENDIPDIIYRFRHLEQEKKRERTDQSFLVPKEEIAQNNYDLSINRYKKVIVKAKDYEDTKVILQKIVEEEKQIQLKLKELEEML